MRERNVAILLAILLVGALLACKAGLLQVVSRISWPTTTQLQTILDLLVSGSTVLAIFGAGAWTYYNYFKGKIYKIEPEVSGRVETINGVRHLIATLGAKNVGLSKVEMQAGTILEVKECVAQGSTNNDIGKVPCDTLKLFPVLRPPRDSQQSARNRFTYLQPDTAMKEQLLIEIPGNQTRVLQLHLWVVAKHRTFRWLKVGWGAMDTVILNKENGMDGNDDIESTD